MSSSVSGINARNDLRKSPSNFVCLGTKIIVSSRRRRSKRLIRVSRRYVPRLYGSTCRPWTESDRVPYPEEHHSWPSTFLTSPPLAATVYVLRRTKELIHDRAASHMPHDVRSPSNKMSWSTVSKAVDICNMPRIVTSYFSAAESASDTI